jgi:hypothetical protein
MGFKLYNNAFKVGVGIANVAFVAANVESYSVASRELAAQDERGIRLSNERVIWDSVIHGCRRVWLRSDH